jgi:rSAM/selenodomain-associated transferase 1
MNNARLADVALIVFFRLPVFGKVKSRLARSVGDEKALEIYLWLTKQTIQTARSLSIPLYFFYEGGLPDITSRLAGVRYYEQCAGDLGQRMLDSISIALQNFKKVIIIGSDCPALTKDILQQAMDKLDEVDVILGPASDGGYYLLGCKKTMPELMEGIPWSTEAVLTKTIERCHQTDTPYSLLPMLADIDTEADWLLWKQKEEFTTYSHFLP